MITKTKIVRIDYECDKCGELQQTFIDLEQDRETPEEAQDRLESYLLEQGWATDGENEVRCYECAEHPGTARIEN